MTEKKIWSPVRTKPRQEKKLQRYCMTYGIPTYLPLLNKTHKYERQSVTFSSPMFPGYIFCRLNQEEYKQILLSNAVVYKIDLNEDEEKKLISELKIIRKFECLSADHEVIVKPELISGTQVEITQGAFAGIQGIVKHRKNSYMLVVNIEFLGQTAAIEIDVSSLDKN